MKLSRNFPRHIDARKSRAACLPFAAALLCSCLATAPGPAFTPVARKGCLTTQDPVKLPPEVKGGDGTSKKRFQVFPKGMRAEEGIGSIGLGFPLTLEVEGNDVFFDMHLSLSQLRLMNRRSVRDEIAGLVNLAARHYLEQRGKAVCGELRFDVDAMIDSFARRASGLDSEAKGYIEK